MYIILSRNMAQNEGKEVVVTSTLGQPETFPA